MVEGELIGREIHVGDVRQEVKEGPVGVYRQINVQKAFWALELAAQLKDQGLDFMLKGGTAVQLVTDPAWPRLSVDTDICTLATRDELEEVLRSIDALFSEGFVFEPRPLKDVDNEYFANYRVKTPRLWGDSRNILLDAHLSLPAVEKEEVPLRSFFYDSDTTLTMPTVGSLIGDKLTTIAPTTVGRKLDSSRKGLDYAKHLFDIQRLLRSSPAPDHIPSAFRTIIEEQCILRGRGFEPITVLEDLRTACEAIATIALPGDLTPENVPRLPRSLRDLRRTFKRGLKDLRPFLSEGTVFGADELTSSAGEAALVATLCVRGGRLGPLVESIASDDFPGMDFERMVERIGTIEPGPRWFLDTSRGLYSPRSLGVWYELLMLPKSDNGVYEAGT